MPLLDKAMFQSTTLNLDVVGENLRFSTATTAMLTLLMSRTMVATATVATAILTTVTTVMMPE